MGMRQVEIAGLKRIQNEVRGKKYTCVDWPWNEGNRGTFESVKSSKINKIAAIETDIYITYFGVRTTF